MIGDRGLEIIAGVAAVIFIATMIWTDVGSSWPRRRQQVRHIQYAMSLIVLVCVVALGVRG